MGTPSTVELAKEWGGKGAEIVKNPNLISLRILVICNFIFMGGMVFYGYVFYKSGLFFWGKLEALDKRQQVYENKIGIPEARKKQLRFENRGKDGWEAGKKFVIDFVTLHHKDYWKNPTIYKSKLLLASQDVLFAEVNKSKMEFGVAELQDFKLLSVKTMQPFIKDIESWIEYICKSEQLEKGWEFDVSVLFNVNMSRWLEELHKLRILGMTPPEKEDPAKPAPREFVFTGEKRDYKNRKFYSKDIEDVL